MMSREHVVRFIRIALSASLSLALVQSCHAGEDVAPTSAPKPDYYPVRVDNGKRWTTEPMGLERCEAFAKRQAVELVCEAQAEARPASEPKRASAALPDHVLDYCIDLGAAEYGGRQVSGDEGAATFKRARRVTSECKVRWRSGRCATARECEVFSEKVK
jgi:hypothetical protein